MRSGAVVAAAGGGAVALARRSPISPDTKLDLTAPALRFLARAITCGTTCRSGQAQNQAYRYEHTASPSS